MPDINPPTGDEQVQKYYSGPYLNEVDELKARVASAAATGTQVDLSNDDVRTIAAVAPHLLTTDQQQALANAVTPGSNVEGNLDETEGKTFVEAQGDEDTRVQNALDNDNNIGNNDASQKDEETPEEEPLDPEEETEEEDEDKGFLNSNN